MIGKEYLTSRERVLRAIEHKKVDRYPIDLGMHPSTGINAFAYHNLRKYLGLNNDNIEVFEPEALLARIDNDIMERFHIDCITFHPGFLHTAKWNPRGEYNFYIPRALNPVLQKDGSYFCCDGTTKGLSMPSTGYFFSGQGFDWWEEDGDSMWKRWQYTADKLYNETDKFTMFCGYGAYYMGDIEFLCDMLTDEEKTDEMIKNLHKDNLRHVKSMIECVGNRIQGVCLGGDMGTQNGPIMDPLLYEEKIHPFMKEFCKYIKDNSDYKIFMHSCGAVREFIPYFIDEGIDVLNPVQVAAKGMDPVEIKKEFGDKLAFWGGGCDTQRVLCLGSVEDVKNNVKYLTDIFKQNSGFVFNQVHNILGDTKPEKIVAMLDTAYENSFYDEN